MENIKKPKKVQKETSVFNKNEAELLLNFLAKEQIMWRVLIKIAITTGLRRGELLGLEWKHIDMDKGTIQVKQTISYANQEYIIKEPKTKSSIRTVSIPASIIPEIKKYKSIWNKDREGWGISIYIYILGW